jgi:regulator of RNase E activity RraB
MGRLRRPELPPGPLDDLVRELHALHARAGWPSMRDLAKGRDFSYTTVHDLFTKTITEPPRLPLLHKVVERLATLAPRANVEEILDKFDALWRATDDEPFTMPSGEPSAPAELKVEFRSLGRIESPLYKRMEVFFSGSDPELLHRAATELRNHGYLVLHEELIAVSNGDWLLKFYSRLHGLTVKERHALEAIANNNVRVDGWGKYVDVPGNEEEAGRPVQLESYEHDVLILLAEGKSVDEITVRLTMTSGAYRVTADQLREKLQAVADDQIVPRARQLGLIRQPPHVTDEPVPLIPTGRAMTKELFFLAAGPAPLHDAAAELRRAGFLVRDQPRDLDGSWSLMAYSAASELSEKDLATLDGIAERCGVAFDGWGTYVGPPHMDDGPGKPGSSEHRPKAT